MGAAGKNSLRRIGLFMGLLMLLTGCAKPTGDYFFVSTETARTQHGNYNFSLDLQDSTGTYAIGLAARLVTSPLTDLQLPLDIRTTTPAGETSIERTVFHVTENSVTQLKKGSGSVVDCEWAWKPVVPVRGAEAGTWQISITPTDPSLLDAIYGIGISYENNYGKR